MEDKIMDILLEAFLPDQKNLNIDELRNKLKTIILMIIELTEAIQKKNVESTI